MPAGTLDLVVGSSCFVCVGGQKARLALARAAYSAADVALLDDPLSAVDPRVGRILFSQCIGPQGIMQREDVGMTGSNVSSAFDVLNWDDICRAYAAHSYRPYRSCQ